MADEPQQPARGLSKLAAATSPELASGLKRWARSGNPNWEDFIALGEKIGADNPEAFAGWLQAIKHGTGKKG